MIESSIVIQKDIFIKNVPDKFLITRQNKTISINKQSNIIKEEVFEPSHETNGLAICGIIGVLEGKESSYLMIIESADLVGLLMDHRIFKVKKVDYLSFNTNKSKADEECLQQIQDFYKRNTFYYSPTLDLSVSFYSVAKNFESRINLVNDNSNIFKYSNLGFVWNFNNTRSIDNSLLSDIIYPIINGYVGVKPVTAYDTDFTYAVISRKETKRSGMRFIVRGADMNGNVANFAETEQIVALSNIKSNKSDDFTVISYIQIRGSIPLLWNQLPNLQLNPPIVLSNDVSSNTQAFNRHFNTLIQQYDKVACINLIDKKGYQKLIGDNYQEFVKKFKQSLTNQNSDTSVIDYTWFDFHSECKKMKYNNIDKLLKAQSVSNALQNQNFTQLVIKKNSFGIADLKGDIELKSRQKGVFRTNCIDNLDRTNVIQGVISRQFLHKILYRLKISEMPHGTPFEAFSGPFEHSFRQIWGDNGDILSKAYSGTNSLKRDFTRTGKRTFKGALDDGINTSTRFYINNFCDGYNQDCHDYYLGNLNPRKKILKAHSTILVNSLIVSVFLLTFIFYSMGSSMVLNQEKEYGIKGLVLRGLMVSGMFLISCISLLSSFKQNVIDLATISYH